MKTKSFVLFTLPLAAAGIWGGCSKHVAEATVAPALSVAVVAPQNSVWPERVSANGSVKAWQECSIASEVNGLQLEELYVDVGDSVKRGQVLARFKSDTTRIDLAASEAAVSEAEASSNLSHSQAERVRRLEGSGSVSQDQLLQAIASEKMGAARLASARAQLANMRLRLSHTEVIAPDDGVITSKSATVGAVLGAGVELFKMIRQNRLEWRASLPADQLAQVIPGQAVRLQAGSLAPVVGRVRLVSPSVDTGTLTGMIYVDLPESGGLKNGMFASGEIQFSESKALHVPETALVYRDGYQYLMRVDEQLKVRPVKVTTLRREGREVEISSSAAKLDRVVVSGGSFLTEGDTVRVVGQEAEGKAAASASETKGDKS